MKAEELKEMLGSLAPDLIVIDGGFFEQIEHLGEFVKRVRLRVSGKLPLARHRLVYAAVGAMMQTDIHALVIRARTPDEAA